MAGVERPAKAQKTPRSVTDWAKMAATVLPVTPRKTYKVVNVSPTTKSLNCVVCNRRFDNADYRRKLFKGGVKTDACLLLERTLDVNIDSGDTSKFEDEHYLQDVFTSARKMCRYNL